MKNIEIINILSQVFGDIEIKKVDLESFIEKYTGISMDSCETQTRISQNLCYISHEEKHAGDSSICFSYDNSNSLDELLEQIGKYFELEIEDFDEDDNYYPPILLKELEEQYKKEN